MDTEANAHQKAISQPSSEQELLSKRLREAREYLGLSQEYVAEQLRVPRVALSAMETGKRKVSSLELKALATIYGRSYEYLLGEENPSETEQAQEQLVGALYRTTKDLSSTDREQVFRFAEFLRHAGAIPKTRAGGDES